MRRFRVWIRRFYQFLSVWSVAGSPVVPLIAARTRSLPATSAFLRKRGNISGPVVSYRNCRFRVVGHHYNCLPHAASLIDSGADLSDLPNGHMLATLPTGLKFILREHELTSGLAMLEERFVLEECAALAVDGAVVLDVGTNIGDSCIYFASKGARRVIGFEPFTQTYESAVCNVKINNLEHQVELINAGLGKRHAVIEVGYDCTRSPLMTTVVGDGAESRGSTTELGQARVVILPFNAILEDIAAQHKGVRLVCKIDCEGCEREIFSDPLPRLECLSELFMEWHQSDHQQVRDLLEAAGFKVSISETAGLQYLIHATRDVTTVP